MTDRQFFDLTITTGDAIRFAFLQSHYRSRMDLGAKTDAGYKKIDDARKTLRRLALACEPNLDGPPVEIIEAVSDDLNTPKAIALLHGYRKAKEGRKLFAALRFLGFWGGAFEVEALKTLPENHAFNAPQYVGFDTPGASQ